MNNIANYENNHELANQYFKEAKKYFRDEKNKKAAYLFKKASEFFYYNQNKQAYITAQLYLIRSKIKQNDFETTHTALENVYVLCLEYVGDQDPLMAEVFCVWGYFYLQKGAYDKALKWFELALEIKQTSYPTNHIRIAKCYYLVGEALNKRGLQHQSLLVLEKALTIAQSQEEIDVLFLSDLYIGFSQNYLRLGDLGESLQLLQKVLAIQLEHLGEKHSMVAKTYNHIGNVYLLKEDYQKCLEFYHKSLAIGLETLGPDHLDIAANYSNIASTHFNFAQYDKALSSYQKSLQLNTKLLGEQSPYNAIVYINMGKCYTAKKHFDLALGMYRRGIKMGQQFWGKFHQNIAHAIVDMGRCCYKKGDFKAAINYFHLAIVNMVEDFEETHPDKNPNLKNHRHSLELQKAFNGKALAYYADYQKNKEFKNLIKSLENYELSIKLTEQERNSYKTEMSKLSLAQRVMHVYDEAIEVSLLLHELTQSSKYLQKAFYFNEKSKSILLLSAMKESEAKMKSFIPDALLKQEQKLRFKLTDLDQKINQELSKEVDQQQTQNIIQWQGQKFDCNQLYEQLIQQFEKEYPQYYQLKYNVKVAELSKVQSYLSQKDTVLLSYFVGKKYIYTFCVKKEVLDVQKMPIPEQFERILQDFEIGMSGFLPKLLRSAHILYKWLIQPVEDFLKDNPKLIIILDGVLHKVNFDVLLKEKSQMGQDPKSYNYLLKSHEIVYQYSATLLLYIAQRAKQTAQLPDNFLGLAPVHFNHQSSETLNYAEIMREEEPLTDLIATQDEVLSIQHLFEQKQLHTHILLNKEANKKNLQKCIKNYKYILFATHGFSHPKHPELSGLYLAPQQEKHEKLYMSEAFNLQIQADLVILNACETGRGKLLEGEGVMALNRGFLYAGATNVIYALYKLVDKSASELMQDFFRLIIDQKMNYAKALKQVKMTAIQQGKSPYHWAGLTLIEGACI